MRILPSKRLIVFICLMICAGCSVKENRTFCPCRLVLDFSEVDTSVIRRADLLLAADDGYFFTDVLEGGDFAADTMNPVPRGGVNVGVWSGAEGMVGSGGMVIPVGSDCPPVYFHSSFVDTDCEIVRDTVCMRKNHCRMTVRIEHGSDSMWDLGLSGTVNGYHSDGSPSSGEFLCRLQTEDEDVYSAVLPRQTDNSLIMDVDDGSGVMKRFSLGEYIEECGYDWTAPDLEDITVVIDVAFTELTLAIGGWDNVYRFEVVI